MSSVAKKRKVASHPLDTRSTYAAFEEDELDHVLLTRQQQLEYAQIWEGTTQVQECLLKEKESPQQNSQRKDCDPDASEAKEGVRRSTSQVVVPTHENFLCFLQDYTASEWNFRKADEFYVYLNASLRIVGPNDILGIYKFSDDLGLTIDSILNRLEGQNDMPAWSAVPEELGLFLDVFEGFEDLANCLLEPSRARPFVALFQRRLRAAQRVCKDKRFNNWYELFINFTKRLLHDISDCEEIVSRKYVKLLIEMFADILGLFVHFDDDELRLEVPLGKGRRKTVYVKPDIILESTHIFLVGEVKKFGCHGDTHEAHGGSAIPTQNDGHQDEKDDPLPCWSTGTVQVSDQGNSDEDKDVHFFPSRCLSARERYKVSCYLPQLLGQILAAMHFNQRPFSLGSSLENAMLGIAVEGFKLRFVKLVLWDHINKTEQPTVRGLLSGERFKSDVYLTQEFNLFKKSHLRMFFKMFLAIYAECGKLL